MAGDAKPSETDAADMADDGIFEKAKDEFKEFYATNLDLHAAAEKAFRNLISQLVDTIDIEKPKISSRLKERDESIKKFYRKYQNNAEKNGPYKISDFITDLIGVRIICLYETDIPKLVNVIKENFEIISITDKTQLLMEDVTSFGYKGLHFDIQLTKSRCDLPEYARFKELRAELQLRSIVQDAWSEVEHKLRYKRHPPIDVQRRIIRLAALFELADQEFSALSAATRKLEAAASSGGALEGGNGNLGPIDSFEFLALVKNLHPKYNFEPEAVDGFVHEIKLMDRNLTKLELLAAIEKLRDKVWKYKQEQRKFNININPFTEIRYVLYAHDKGRFLEMLYPNQRASFEAWIQQPPEELSKKPNVNRPSSARR